MISDIAIMKEESQNTIVGSNYKQLFKNFIILIIALGIFVSPFIVDYSSLPQGFELPKVYFWEILSVIIITSSIFYFFYNIIMSSGKFIITKDFIILFLVLSLFLISSVFSPFQNIAWIGNEFRYQGFITHALIVIVCFITYKFINKNNWHFICFAFVLSGLWQAIDGIRQFFLIIKPNPDLYFDGFWVNGTFGQTNWFSGRLLIAIIFSSFYLGFRIKNYLKVNSTFINLISLEIIKMILCSFSIILMMVAIALSRSIWAMITLPLIVLLVISYEILGYKLFLYLFRFLCLLIILAGIFLFSIYHDYNIRVDIWQNILNIMFQQPIPDKFKRILFGYGFDTLGNVFQTFGRFKGGIIDRAHNFIFDILIQNGVIIFAPLIYLVFKLNSILKKALKGREFTFTLIALTVWVFRSFIHESGIVNMLDFLILISCTFGLAFKSNELD